MKLDYSLKAPSERVSYIEELLSTLPKEELTSQNLTYMSDYILFVVDRDQTKKERHSKESIITKNREVTVSKRQVSFEGLISTLENGEDGLYSRITNDKNQIMDQRDKISEEDISTIPGVRESLQQIELLQEKFKEATGQKKYLIKKQIIETWQQIYLLKSSFKNFMSKSKISSQVKNMAHVPLNESIHIGKEGLPHSDAMVSLFDPVQVSFLLCYYSVLKQECYEDLNSDMFYLLLDLENLIIKTFKNEPVLMDLIIWKVDGRTNEEIQKLMESHYGIQHNGQYFSTLWRQRIPKMLVEQASKDWLIWHYTNEEYGIWKKCGKCGKVKLAHPLFFSKNSSEDGYYSICKDCRKKK